MGKGRTEPEGLTPARRYAGKGEPKGLTPARRYAGKGEPEGLAPGSARGKAGNGQTKATLPPAAPHTGRRALEHMSGKTALGAAPPKTSPGPAGEK